MKLGKLGKLLVDPPLKYKGREVYFHLLHGERRLNYKDDRRVRIGVWHKAKTADGSEFAKEISLCVQGMHACAEFQDARDYHSLFTGSWVCLVELRGSITHGEDKAVALERRVLAWRKIARGELSKVIGFDSGQAKNWVVRSKNPNDKAEFLRGE